MNDRQQLFIREYLVDLNATAAATRAGYKCPNVAGARLLANVSIRTQIEQKQNKISQKLDITAERVLRELARIGFSDPRQLFNDDGGLKDIRTLDTDAAVCIASIEVYEEFQGRGEARKQIGFTKKVKLWDKVAALEKLGKNLGLFKDIHEHSGLDGGAIPIIRMIAPADQFHPEDYVLSERQALNGSVNGTNGTGTSHG